MHNLYFVSSNYTEAVCAALERAKKVRILVCRGCGNKFARHQNNIQLDVGVRGEAKLPRKVAEPASEKQPRSDIAE